MDHGIFSIDTKPNESQIDDDVPQYKVGRKSIELSNSEKKIAERNKLMVFNPCWNCGKTTHNIRDCNAQNNSITVEWYRELMFLRKDYQAKMQIRSGRYHSSDKKEKYKHLTLGVPSKKLRTILGLPERHLPSYVYRLRQHGYPKAWLKYATVNPSGLNLYDAHGNEIAEPDTEDGEVIEQEDKIRYDLSKLIEFPGFNVPAPPNTDDIHEKLQAPPFSDNQSLQCMIETLKEKAITEYCLKRENSQKSISRAENNSESKMETNTPENINVHSGYGSTAESSHFQIQTVTCSQSDIDNESVEIDTISQDSRVLVSNKNATPSRESLGRILSSAEGTPLLRSMSGYAQLPPAENFSKNISDVINFENLPESTGTYEKMRSLLKRMRNMIRVKNS